MEKKIQLVIGAKDEASAALQQVEDKFGALKSAGKALAAALGPLAGAMAVREILDAQVAWEGYNNALKTVTGSQDAANEELAFVRDLAQRLGLSLGPATDAYVQFAAAAKGTAVEGQQTRQVFEAVSSAATVLGLSSETTSGALLALSQMLGKGKVSAEELRGQLGERIPGAFQLAANAIGVSTAELDKMLQSGEIVADEFLPRFAEQLMQTYGPGVADAARSTQAALNRFHTSIYELKLNLAETGIVDVFVSAMEALGDAVSDPRTVESIRGLGDSFENLVKGSGPTLSGMFNGIIVAFQAFATGVQVPITLIKTFGEVIAAAAAAASLAIEGDFKGAMAVLQDSGPAEVFNREFDKLNASAQSLRDSLTGVKDEAQETGAAQKAVAADAGELATATEQAAAAVDQEAAAIEAAKEKILENRQAKILQRQAELELAGASREAAKAQAEREITEGKTAESAAAAAKAIRDQALELEKIASNERIRNIELAVGIKTEQLKADTEKVKALFASVDAALADTGETMRSLSSDFAGLGSSSLADLQKASFLEDMIEDENKRREKAFEMEQKLAQAQLERLEIQNRRLKDGDAVLKVQADGLAPHLEAIWFEILEQVQIRATEEEAQFLIGAGLAGDA